MISRYKLNSKLKYNGVIVNNRFEFHSSNDMTEH